jgi:hypothetical protein
MVEPIVELNQDRQLVEGVVDRLLREGSESRGMAMLPPRT